MGDGHWQIVNPPVQLRSIRDCGTANCARANGYSSTASIDGYDAKQLHTCMVMERHSNFLPSVIMSKVSRIAKDEARG